MKFLLPATIGLVVLAAIGSTVLATDNNKAADAVPVVGADGFRSLEWSNLSPPLSSEAQQAATELNFRIDQMTDDEVENAMALINGEGNTLVPELDDTDVSIEGFLVPIDFDSEKISDFVLVPYFGACIHVPPPPPNQIVYVKFREGLALADVEAGMYTPYRVKGRIKAARTKTELADVGYQISASDIEQDEEL